MKLNKLLFVPVFLLFLVSTAPAIDVPYLSARVNDLAHILSEGTEKELEGILRDYERKTGNQIAVLTIPSLDGEPLEDYSMKVAETWKLGQKGKDNGVLLLVSKNDRKLRIEVGYGLEGELTDGICGGIIRNVMTPQFKKGDFDGGITDGVKTIIGSIEKTVSVEEAVHADDADTSKEMDTTERILIGFFIFPILGLFTFMGIVTPGAGWILYFFLMPFWSMFPLFVIGTKATAVLLAAYLTLFPLLKIRLRKTRFAETMGLRFSGSGSSSGSSSGFSSRSGFSGGGGSFGGGGASGSW
jgi:uncharacterized protein